MLTPVKTRIRIGGTGFAYLMVAALIFAAAWLTQNNLMFWAFGLMVGGLLAALLLAALTLRGIRLTRLLPDHAVVGEPLVVRYQIHNGKIWLPVFNLTIQETWGRGRRGWKKTGPLAETPARLGGRPLGWVLHLGLRQTLQAQAVCWPLRRGDLHFERIVVRSSFPFGILQRVLEFVQPGQVLVYPRLYRINRTLWFKLALADPVGRLHLDRGGGTEEFFGLRPYRPGDSLRTIDWKHSAKSSELIARELTQASPPRLILALDLSLLPGARRNAAWEPQSAPDEDPAEQAISLAASVVCAAHLQGYQTGFMVLGAAVGYFKAHHSVPHRGRILEALARLEVPAQPDTVRAPLAAPTLRVTVGPEAAPAQRRCLVLSTQEMAQHVRHLEGGSTRLLARGVVPRTKRQRLSLNDPWT